MVNKVQIYMSTVTGSSEIKKHQQHIKMVLESKGIEFEEVDISADTDLKDKMRKIVGDDTCLPPQICRGGDYLGDYEKFSEAIEEEELETFLKLKK